jgi:hypothetical protein
MKDEWWQICPRCGRTMAEACRQWQRPKHLDRAVYDPKCFFAEIQERAAETRGRLAQLAAIAPGLRTAEESAQLVAALRRAERRRNYQRDWHRAQRAAAVRTKGVLDGLAKVG